MNSIFIITIIICCVLSFFTSISNGLNSLTPSQFLSGNDTLLSQNRTFELGFFTPANSTNFYIGIWYTISLPNRVVVWVANRDHPVPNPSSCKLQLLRNGNLALLDRFRAEIWSTNWTSAGDAESSNSTVAMLLDSGNLVVRDSSRLLWQSFDYPTDHWLPGGKIGHNKRSRLSQKLRPWRSTENPAPSLFSVEVEPNGTSHVLIWNETRLYWSTGEWNGKIFEYIPEIVRNFYIKNLRYVDNDNESYFTYDAGIPGALTRFMMDSTGQLKQFIWGRNFTQWSIIWTRPSQQCEVYAFCGAFSTCNNIQTPLCECLPGFEPGNLKNWDNEDHMDGCRHKRPLQCNNGRGEGKIYVFNVVSGIRFPSNAVTMPLENAEDCQSYCSSTCNCTAQAYDDGRCLHWIGDLFNLLHLPPDDTTGKEIYIKISASDQEAGRGGESKTKSGKNTLWIVVGTTTGCFCFVVVLILLVFRKRRAGEWLNSSESLGDSLMVFKYRDLRTATKNFSDKLGEGGFGFVYKGTLPNSTVIAVKRLKTVNKDSVQEKQFRAEVSTIGTIQHMNLVRLRGFCIKDSTRFLVFDYMPNGSLEHKLFAKDADVINWNMRYKIALGIARGLAYLHEKCRDRIIHCDIKPENILLDAELNPKIADFGLSKLIGREFSRVLTTMRGTRGYLAPEWISGEPITEKADVFSYGMLLLEIVSGRRNTGGSSGEFFPAHVAKRIWAGEEVTSLLDGRVMGEGDEEEVGRVCRVACWCIRDEEKNRPSMGQVVQILEGVVPQVPVFCVPQFLQVLVDEDGETPNPYVLTSFLN